MKRREKGLRPGGLKRSAGLGLDRFNERGETKEESPHPGSGSDFERNGVI